jgi:hypothetical protein
MHKNTSPFKHSHLNLVRRYIKLVSGHAMEVVAQKHRASIALSIGCSRHTDQQCRLWRMCTTTVRSDLQELCPNMK